MVQTDEIIGIRGVGRFTEPNKVFPRTSGLHAKLS